MADLLKQLIVDLLMNKRTTVTLSGGLYMQYRQADADNHYNRLYCYRIGDVPPSITELVVVRQHLEQILPPGTNVAFRKQQKDYEGSDGLMRRGFLFLWERPLAQAALFAGNDDEERPLSPGAFEGAG